MQTERRKEYISYQFNFFPIFYRRGQISFEEPELLDAQFDSHTRSGTQKMGAKNQSVCLIETQLETLLVIPYNLNRTYSFHFKCVSIKSFCNNMFL